MKPMLIVLILLGVCAAPLAAQTAGDGDLPAFAAVPGVSGEIRIWGSPADAGLINDWREGFRKFHPDARIEASLNGPDSTMAGVYTGVADLAFLAREMRQPVERMAFEWVYHHPATTIEIAVGGLAADRPSAALAVFVARGNPLSRLTLAQLDAVFSAEHLRGDRDIRIWGAFGLGGEWSDRPIHVYGPVVDGVWAAFLREAVMQNSYKWNPDYRQVAEKDAAALLARLAADPCGIAYAPLWAANDGVKAVALAAGPDGPFVEPTRDALVAQSYPLTRKVTMVLNRPPGRPIEPRVKEFLRYILSREGQAAILRDGGHLPLNGGSLRKQLDRLEASAP